jgi:hypothetical protein
MPLAHDRLFRRTWSDEEYIYTKCGVSSLSVIYNAFIQFASDLHGISHGCSHILCVCFYIKIAAISSFGRPVYRGNLRVVYTYTSGRVLHLSMLLAELTGGDTRQSSVNSDHVYSSRDSLQWAVSTQYDQWTELIVRSLCVYVSICMYVWVSMSPTCNYGRINAHVFYTHARTNTRAHTHMHTHPRTRTHIHDDTRTHVDTLFCAYTISIAITKSNIGYIGNRV